MTNNLIWDNEEKTVLRQIYTVNFTVDDILEMASATYRLITSTPHTVHLFVELTDFSRSSQISFMDAAKDLDAMVAGNQGYVISIGGGMAMRYTANTMTFTAPKASENVRFVDTIEEARQLLKQLTLQ